MYHLIQKSFCLLLLALFFLSGCEAPKKPIEVNQKWQEEVLLHNNSRIIINRSLTYQLKVLYKDRTGPMMNTKYTIIIPKNDLAPSPPYWSFDADPILLDYDTQNKKWFIVATARYCHQWVKAGKPLTSQWQYEVQDSRWVVVPLGQSLIGREANLFSGDPDEKTKLSKITYQDTQKELKRTNNLRYKKIIQEQAICRS